MSTRAACSLTVLLAREAPVGLIFRRGPTRWVQAIRWQTNTDVFEDGDWINGRIYPEQSDLSPDGRRLMYVAMNAHWVDATKNAWTAISDAPSFKPLIHWNRGPGPGGGGFLRTTGGSVLQMAVWKSVRKTGRFYSSRPPVKFFVTSPPLDTTQPNRNRIVHRHGTGRLPTAGGY